MAKPTSKSSVSSKKLRNKRGNRSSKRSTKTPSKKKVKSNSLLPEILRTGRRNLVWGGLVLWVVLLLFLGFIIQVTERNKAPLREPGPTGKASYERKELLGLENKIQNVDSIIYHFLLNNGIYSENILYKVEKRRDHNGTSWDYCEMKIPVPRTVNLKSFGPAFRKHLEGAGQDVSIIQEKTDSVRLVFGVTIEGCLTHHLIFVPQNGKLFDNYKKLSAHKRPKIAIVIDDFGAVYQQAEKFLKIPVPITFSILPFRPHSAKIAKLVHQHNHEIILHLPMEPYGYPTVNPGSNALLLSMTDKQVLLELRKDLDCFDSFIVGTNNHMGSAFTENAEKMKIVLKEIKKRNLFFLDSLTSPHSVAYRTAKSLNMACARRNIFLDAKQKKVFIEGQLNKLVSIARKNGKAIAIGHPYEVTFKILKRRLPKINKNTVDIVPLSEIIN